MSKRAFTLSELLVAITVLLVLAALIFAVGIGAVRQAHRTRAMVNLKQHYLALAIYRTTYEGDAVTGTASEMGLPTAFAVYNDAELYLEGIGAGSFRSTFPTHPSIPRRTHNRNLCYYPTDEFFAWARRVQIRGEAVVLIADFNTNEHNVNLDSETDLKLGIGVSLSGSAMRRNSAFPYSYEFWDE